LAALGRPSALPAAPAAAAPIAPATFAGAVAAPLSVAAAVSNDCLSMLPAIVLAASAAVSFSAVVASCVNWFVSAPHHCIGSTTPEGTGAALPERGFAGAASAAAGD